MRIIKIAILSIILLSFLISVWSLPKMPSKMVSHWNALGEADGYLPKHVALFLMPFILVGLALLFWLIPKIDPLKENIEKFRKYYDFFFLLLIIFLFYVYLLSVLYNLGWKINMSRCVPPAIGLFFYYLGILLSKAKRNWFIGIKTPWTLSSEKVWEHTHQRASKLFKISGILALVGIFFSHQAIYFVIVPVIFVSAYLVVFSYFDYQREVSVKEN